MLDQDIDNGLDFSPVIGYKGQFMPQLSGAVHRGDSFKMSQVVEKPRIFVGMGTCGIAAGGQAVLDAISGYLSENKLDADLVETACVGICFAEPLVDIHTPGHSRVVYQKVKANDVPKILDDHLNKEAPLAKKAIAQWNNGEEAYDGIPAWTDLELNKKQHRFILHNCGIIDPGQHRRIRSEWRLHSAEKSPCRRKMDSGAGRQNLSKIQNFVDVAAVGLTPAGNGRSAPNIRTTKSLSFATPMKVTPELLWIAPCWKATHTP